MHLSAVLCHILDDLACLGMGITCIEQEGCSIYQVLNLCPPTDNIVSLELRLMPSV